MPDTEAFSDLSSEFSIVWPELFRDLAAEFLAQGGAFRELSAEFRLSLETFCALRSEFQVGTGELFVPFSADFLITDGNTYPSIASEFWILPPAPAFSASTMQRLSSVLSEVA